MSSIARVEVVVALWRKHRVGELSLGDVATLVDEFEWEWFAAPEPWAVVATGDAVIERAALMTGIHGLRAYDAIQLATAVEARAADPDLTVFACFDAALAKAARVEGFQGLPRR